MKIISIRTSTIVLLCTSVCINTAAQHLSDIHRDSLKNTHHIIDFSNSNKEANTDSIKAIIEKFYYDQFRHSQNPNAPYFLFMSRDAGLTMGIGGAVRMRAYYDWDGAIAAPGFAPFLI